MRYESPQNCTQCKEGLYILNGVCTKLETIISDCLYQQDNTSCLVCKEDKLLNGDKKQCLSVAKFKDCQFYSSAVCKRCKNEYIFNKNQFYDYFLNLAKQGVNFQLENTLFKAAQKVLRGEVPPPCQLISVSHCQEIEAYNKCKTCLVGYYKDSSAKCV